MTHKDFAKLVREYERGSEQARETLAALCDPLSGLDALAPMLDQPIGYGARRRYAEGLRMCRDPIAELIRSVGKRRREQNAQARALKSAERSTTEGAHASIRAALEWASDTLGKYLYLDGRRYDRAGVRRFLRAIPADAEWIQSEGWITATFREGRARYRLRGF